MLFLMAAARAGWGEWVPPSLPALLPLESVLSLCFFAGEPFSSPCSSLFRGEMKCGSPGLAASDGASSTNVCKVQASKSQSS